jgi:thiosulfate/3-mercaptopyruvate sulfurtransferase
MANPKGIMTNPEGPFPFCWPEQQQFEAAMTTLGVGNDTPVILYSASNPAVPGSGIAWVTRAWWLMRHYGVECAILDGGWQKWQREKRPASAEDHRYSATTFAATPAPEYGVANRDDVLAAISDPATLLIDSLSPQSYRGEVDSNYGIFGRRKGHITSAVNIHFQNMINPDTGCFRSAEEIHKMFSPLEVHQYRKLITYCGGGLGATVNSVALKLAGIHHVAIYDGSLMEWANDPDLPMTDYSA